MLDKLPKRPQARAEETFHRIREAPGRKGAQRGLGRFTEEFEAEYPKATACRAKDAEDLLAFLDLPAER